MHDDGTVVSVFFPFFWSSKSVFRYSPQKLKVCSGRHSNEPSIMYVIAKSNWYYYHLRTHKLKKVKNQQIKLRDSYIQSLQVVTDSIWIMLISIISRAFTKCSAPWADKTSQTCRFADNSEFFSWCSFGNELVTLVENGPLVPVCKGL